jgi:RNA polymerase sigma-70 factor (ECF subfamily)
VKVGMSARSKKDVEMNSGELVGVRPLVAGRDISLVTRCVEGDETAWRDLHRTYYPVAAAFLRKLGIKEGELADTCQEVFVTLFRHLPTFRGESELKTWLYRLCATEAAKSRRRSRLWGTMLRVLHQEHEGEPIASLEWSQAHARKKVDEALDLMKADERLVFVLFEMEGLKGEQIASVVGCPVATVWRRLHYARRAFSEALGVKERSDEA